MSTLIVKVDHPAYGGFFIGRHEGKIVMMSGAVLPGETVKVTVEEERRDYIKAAVREILKPSPFRTEPTCKYFGSCGGCQLQHIPYDMQIRLKENILMDCLKRQAKTEAKLSEPITDSDPWNYRLRGQFKVSHSAVGFYREKTREIVDIDYCPLMTKDINEYLKKIRGILKNIHIREMHITAGEDSTSALIKSDLSARSSSDIKLLASIFLDLGFSGLCIETRDKEISCFGEKYITLNLFGNQRYTVSPMTFFQSHWRLNNTVIEFIRNCLQPLKNKKVLDLYSGAGNFSIQLAIDADVTGVEENPYAIADGNRNLEINNIKNYRFINSSAENFRIKNNFDIIILDPPRAGITNRLIEMIISLRPDKIVYISCNPSTLSRDLKKLLGRYDLESLRMIDFFPQTSHIESLAYLRIR
jgi:23S rRNA (uracil1939-C5)-methyltransferase